MAEIVLAGVIRKAAEIASNLIIKEGSDLNQLQECVSWIETEMKRIQAFLKDVEAIQAERQGVENLINEIWDLAYDVDDIMDTYFPQLASEHKRKGFLGFVKSVAFIFFDSSVAHNFVMEIKKIKTRVNDIKRARKTYDIPENDGNNGTDRWDPRRSFPHVDEPNIVGFETHIKELETKLMSTDLQHHVVSIVGMPGLGKTTLAKKVFRSVQDRFQCSAWVFVSQKPTIKDLLQDIARQVGLVERERNEDMEANLFNFLREKRYVIVIDDIWHTQTWDALSIGIPIDSGNGSRIIVTSHLRNVGTYIGGQYSLHELLPLDPEKSKELFFKMVMVHPQTSNVTSDPSKLENVGLQILDRCGGVPLAIVVTTSLWLLSERMEQAWREVLNSMGRNHDEISKTLALSYGDLPTDLKPCFLYFGLFPEEHEISAVDLINLWVAEGFIKARGKQEVEDVGRDYLNNLIARNLIQVVRRRYDGSVRSCRIHDLLYNLCILESEKSNFFNTLDSISLHPPMRVRRITIHGNMKDYISLNYQTPNPKLRALLCFNREDMILGSLKSFLEDFKFIRVLKVECKKLTLSLPKEIGNLSHLSYLGFWGNGIVDLPSTISDLKNLLTLHVRRCTILCPTSIWKMKQLRHIYGVFMRYESHTIEVSLPNLQTLYVKLPRDNLMPCWLHKFTNLRKLRIRAHEDIADQVTKVLSNATPVSQKLENLRFKWNVFSRKTLAVNLNLSRYLHVCKLQLIGRIRNLPKPDELPPNLTKLTLRHINLEEDPFKTLRKLPKLRILKLSTIGDMRMMVCCGGSSADNFPQLQVLEIEYLYHLEELIVEEGGMPRLNKLSIRNFPKLRPLSDNLKNITMLSSRRGRPELIERLSL